ncbi:hypothetical protein EDC04DRAFT_2835129 [Pisolithus marmoratus]|nr:hypothetical protein EDC04DRAFT_2835129 [Pisolithus marmoratus]
MDPMGMLHHLLCHASDLWKGKKLALKVALIEATENWEKLTGEAHHDICETMKLDAEQRGVDKTLEVCQNMISFRPEGWCPLSIMRRP